MATASRLRLDQPLHPLDERVHRHRALGLFLAADADVDLAGFVSLSPTTSWNGTFCMACSRILAFIFSLRRSTCTRTPAAFSFSPTSFA